MRSVGLEIVCCVTSCLKLRLTPYLCRAESEIDSETIRAAQCLAVTCDLLVSYYKLRKLHDYKVDLDV